MARGATIETVAIPWLHVIREHPALLAKYTNIFDAPNRTQCAAYYLLGRGRAFAVHARKFIRLIKSNGRLWLCSKKIPSSVDYLFISHLLSPSQRSNSDDFYFGDIPEKLAAHGYSVAIALINHSGKSATPISDLWEKSRVTRIILFDSLSLYDEIVLYKRLRKESNRLRAEAMRQSGSLERMVYLRSAEEALSSGALGALRLASQIRRLVAQTCAKTVVITHEGHSWERTVIATARMANPSVRCIGYQHAAVFRLQHALRRNLSSEYNPDQIVTAGLAGKKQLDASPRLQNIPITILGSNRAISQTKRTWPTKRPIKKRIGKGTVCLVLPEGIPSECQILFNFSIACSKKFPNIRFIWRLHPIVNFQKLRHRNCELKKLPPSISISGDSLVNDFAKSDVLLYRGSTAAVQAIAAGLQPIYLQAKKELSIDPLHEINNYITKIKNIQEFGKAINIAKRKSGEGRSKKDLHIQKYCKGFFTKLNPSALLKANAKYSRR